MDRMPHGALQTSEHKRRKVEVDLGSAQVKLDRGRGAVTDKAKANYLSGQLRVRLQYAKLKVEHGWQRQSLSEVENLYFRHTHLTRPYPIISPGGRRTGRTLPSNSSLLGPSSSTEVFGSPFGVHFDGNRAQVGASMSASEPGPSTKSAGSLSGSSSSSSVASAATLSMPSTPAPDSSHITTPLAPHLGFGSVTRYPITRSDSTSTLIIESTPSLYQTAGVKPSTSASSSTLQSQTLSASSSHSQSAFHEPFDPMEPTEQVDSQLAALRSIISASSNMPIPLPPPSPAPIPTASVASASGSPGTGLTYDAFWSAHGSAPSYRSVLSVHAARAGSVAPLQAHSSSPAVLGASLIANGGTRTQSSSHTNGSETGLRG